MKQSNWTISEDIKRHGRKISTPCSYLGSPGFKLSVRVPAILTEDFYRIP